MKTPVIIAAYNEAGHIGTTLRRLEASEVEPIVMVNGEIGAQETIEAAEKYTNNVYFSEEQGKLPAIQSAFRMLYDRDAATVHEPLILLDADSRPIFPRAWHQAMTDAVRGDEARIASGTYIYTERNPVIFAYRALRSLQIAHQAKANTTLKATYGRNMSVNFAGDQELFDRVLNMEHIWPGEDRYMARVVGGQGLKSFSQLTGVQPAVFTSSRFTTPFGYRLLHGSAGLRDAVVGDYMNRRAAGATHYYTADEPAPIPYDTADAEL